MALCGGAGHSIEIAKKLSNKGILIGIDRDEDALTVAKEKLKAFQMVEIDSALFKIAFQILENYTQIKLKNATLDFDDLTNKTLELLKKSQKALMITFFFVFCRNGHFSSFYLT